MKALKSILMVYGVGWYNRVLLYTTDLTMFRRMPKIILIDKLAMTISIICVRDDR